jgi:hypothetical protein
VELLLLIFNKNPVRGNPSCSHKKRILIKYNTIDYACFPSSFALNSAAQFGHFSIVHEFCGVLNSFVHPMGSI